MGKYHASYIPYIEQTIRKSGELGKQFFVNNTIPLKKGDIVECTYIKGIYKIDSINLHGNAKISRVDNSNYNFTVSTEFVRLYAGNPKAVKVLFEP